MMKMIINTKRREEGENEDSREAASHKKTSVLLIFGAKPRWNELCPRASQF